VQLRLLPLGNPIPPHPAEHLEEADVHHAWKDFGEPTSDDFRRPDTPQLLRGWVEASDREVAPIFHSLVDPDGNRHGADDLPEKACAEPT